MVLLLGSSLNAPLKIPLLIEFELLVVLLSFIKKKTKFVSLYLMGLH